MFSENMKNCKDMRFGVIKESDVVKSHGDINEKRVVRQGTLIEIHSQSFLEDLVVFQVFESNREGDKIDNRLWEGEITTMLPIMQELWAAFQAISSPLQRVQIAENIELCNKLASLKVGEIVNLAPDKFHGGELFEPELSLIQYKGPVPELGDGHFFGLELLVSDAGGDCDGSICGKRYFTCRKNHGIFVSLNRLIPYQRNKTVDFSLQAVNGFPEHNTSGVIPLSSAILMPSNDKRVQHYCENADSSSYKTTLVFHLKEKENMPRNQPYRLERTEKLIDLESSCNSREVDNTALQPGDRVVWFGDAEPEYATVKWIGHLNNSSDVMVGIDCDNPVGSGTGSHDDQIYFRTRKDHAKFIPLASLVKAEDFQSKPADHVKKKTKNSKYIENCSSPTGHQCSALSGEPPLLNLIDVPDNIPSPFHSKDKQDNGLCRSEYVFSETGLESSGLKMDNVGKHSTKDSRNNNVKKLSSSNYLGEVSPQRHCASVENVSPKHLNDLVLKNNNEQKLRHSTMNQTSSQSVVSNSDGVSEWPILSDCTPVRERRPRAVAPSGRPTKLNNTTSKESLLEVVGEGLFPSQSKLAEVNDPFLSTSPSASSDGSTGYEHFPDSPNAKEPTDLGVGSVVEVSVKGSPRYGVIRWIGVMPEDKKKGRKVAGIEMEEDVGFSDGTFNGRRYFQCNPKKAMFVSLSQCQKDSRFQDMHPYQNDAKAKNFGQMMCPVIPGVVRPLNWRDDTDAHCGKFRGIQGHHNSCYLDATLFSMFTFTSVFDDLLFRPPTENDIAQYQEVQRVLREEIVNPLRQNLYVRADRVMKLRTLLENLSSVTGLTSEEKDPEEFLTSLVAQILRAEPFLKLSSGQEAYHYQLFVEKDEQLIMPSVQQLFDQSFLTSDIKLKEVPSCLIIQMPRFGKSFKMYPRILPTQLLDVTDIIEDSPRQCTVCGKLAKYECRECFGQCGSGLESIAFCTKCLETAHSHQRREGHAWRKLQVPLEYAILQDHCHIPRLYMELFAVVCIETSHYVAFVKCGSGVDAPWCFFDSMADRKGEQNGYNIPEMVLCPKLPYWLSEEGSHSLKEIRDDRLLPEHAKRLLCDAYMCMYQSPDVMMYR